MSFDNLEEKRVKARKEHRCDWCRCRIKKGEEYTFSKSIQDGDFNTWKSCDTCKAYVQEMFDKGWDKGEGYCTQSQFADFMINEHGVRLTELWGS